MYSCIIIVDHGSAHSQVIIATEELNVTQKLMCLFFVFVMVSVVSSSLVYYFRIVISVKEFLNIHCM